MSKWMKIFWSVLICRKSKTVFPASSESRFLCANGCTSWNRPTTRVYTQCRQNAKPQINFLYLTSVTCAKSAESIPPLGIDQTLWHIIKHDTTDSKLKK